MPPASRRYGKWFTRSAGQCDQCLGETSQPDSGGVDRAGDLLECLRLGAPSECDKNADGHVDRPAR